jgi:hypothetical protein
VGVGESVVGEVGGVEAEAAAVGVEVEDVEVEAEDAEAAADVSALEHLPSLWILIIPTRRWGWRMLIVKFQHSDTTLINLSPFVLSKLLLPTDLLSTAWFDSRRTLSMLAAGWITEIWDEPDKTLVHRQHAPQVSGRSGIAIIQTWAGILTRECT